MQALTGRKVHLLGIKNYYNLRQLNKIKAKESNRYFAREDIQTVDKHMERISTQSGKRKLPVKR